MESGNPDGKLKSAIGGGMRYDYAYEVLYEVGMYEQRAAEMASEAVAISDAPVGVDIEVLDRPLHPGLPKKILTPGGQAEFAALEEIRKQPYLLQKWCEKESLFKWREAAKKSVILRSRKATKNPQHLPCRAIDGGPSLQAAQDDRNFCHTGTVTVAGEVYCYAVATQDDTVELKILNAE